MEKSVVKYPVGQQSFEVLRAGGYLYVDKTRFIEQILNGGQYYFLGRPRRFGKSLFLSTLKCFFEGKRELFSGLYIDTLDWNWETYPVIYLDFNPLQYKEDENLDTLIEGFISEKEKEFGIEPVVPDHSLRFSNIIKTMSDRTGKRVVILVDEYDKPLVNNIHNSERFEKYRDKLAALYSNFKSSADYIQLVFLAGVSRFGKLSVFSGLNNINDISFDIEFSDICGVTEDELQMCFKEGIQELAKRYGREAEEEIGILKRYYDGYHFSEECRDIYNPFSLLQVFSKRKYNNYWVSSGTPTLLADLLKRTNEDLSRLINKKCSQSELEGLDVDQLSPVALLYQTGYLTIKKYDSRRDIYHLGLPNEEVKQGFFEFILPYYASLSKSDVRPFVFDLIDELEEGRVDDFMTRLQSLFAGIGYDMRFEEERNVQNAMLVVFSLVGLNVNTEIKTSDGRIDILVRTNRFVYVMELKYDGSAQEALEQIKNKDYAMPWAMDGREIIEIGINYSSEKRRIDSWLTNVKAR